MCSIGVVYLKHRSLAFESSKCDPGDLLISDESVLSFRFVISLKGLYAVPYLEGNLIQY